MTTATMTNSKPRKQLSDQIDRLDQILDGLSEALNEAVAEAAKEGVQTAVKNAVVELLTDATLRARLHEATAPEPESAPPTRKIGFWARMKAKASHAASAVTQAASHLVKGAVRGAREIADGAAECIRSLQSLGSMRKLVLVGVGVGAVVGMTSLLAPHAVAAAVSAVTGAVAAAAVQTGVWARRALRAFTMA